MSDSEHEDQQEPKLVIDTDWKEQVAKEKEAAGSSEQDLSPIAADTGDGESNDGELSDGESSRAPSEGEHEFPPPPPASFDVLISMLFTQAMSMLGQMPDPASGEATVNKLYAKHYIDTLDMLSEKTSGNLSDDESKMLAEALHALRMMYVNAKQ
jgi:hypothetical protein